MTGSQPRRPRTKRNAYESDRRDRPRARRLRRASLCRPRARAEPGISRSAGQNDRAVRGRGADRCGGSARCAQAVGKVRPGVPHRQRNNNLAEGAGKKGPLRHQGLLSRRPHLLRVGAAVSAPLTRTLVQYEATCHALAEFSPRRTSQRNAAADAVINYRKRIRDWPTLERAVDIKSREQQRFVSW